MSLIAVYERARNNNESTTQLICYIPEARNMTSRPDGHSSSDAMRENFCAYFQYGGGPDSLFSRAIPTRQI